MAKTYTAASKPASNQGTASIVALAQKYVGIPYKWGGQNPSTGFDCSGLVQYIYAQAGISIPRVTYDQVNAGQEVARSDLRPGDIVFFGPTSRGPGHEALYIGGGKIIAASHTGTDVQVQNLDDVANADGYVTARRVIPDGSPLLTNVAQAADPTVTATPSSTKLPSLPVDQQPPPTPAADQPTTAPSAVLPTGNGPTLPSVTAPAASQYPLPGGGPTMPGTVNYDTHGQQAADSWQLLAATPGLHPDTLGLLQIAGVQGGSSN